MAIRFAGIFSNGPAFQHYVKHLRRARKFVHVDNSWYTEAAKQVERGAIKATVMPPVKVAVKSRQVLALVNLALEDDELEIAALMAISRQFLLRVPSEALPMQWQGSHSRVTLAPTQATLTLSRRKNSAVPVTLKRECCCSSMGAKLCGVHWLHRLHQAGPGVDGRGS